MVWAGVGFFGSSSPPGPAGAAPVIFVRARRRTKTAAVGARMSRDRSRLGSPRCGSSPARCGPRVRSLARGTGRRACCTGWVVRGNVASDVTCDVAPDFTSDVRSDVASCIKADVASGGTFDVTSDVASAVTFDVTSDVTSDVASAVTSDVASDVASDVTSDVTCDATSGALTVH